MELEREKWLPLESNPDVINEFMVKIGVPKKWIMRDLLEFNSDYLISFPNPILAVLLLFPFSKEDSKYCEEKKFERAQIDRNVYFMRQSTECACGTIALIHAIANKINYINPAENAYVRKFIDSTKELSPSEKEAALLNDKIIRKALYESCDPEKYLGEICRHHYVTFVQIDSKLYELDGRKNIPIYHKETTPDLFLKDCADLCKEYIQRDPNRLNFSALVLGSN